MKRALIVTLLATFGGAVDAVAQDNVRLQEQALQKLMDASVAPELEIRMRWVAPVTPPPTAVVPVVALTAPVVKTKGASWVHPDYLPRLARSRAPQSLRRTGGKR